ncbi:IucA/IucC family protein [Cupriavidus basilensis]
MAARHDALGETFAAEFAAGELINLPGISIAARPTMSFRTVAATDAPGGPMLGAAGQHAADQR